MSKVLLSSLGGGPQLKREEKRRYLGIFADQVIEAFEFGDLEKEDIKERVVEALKHPQAGQLRVSSQLQRGEAMGYIALARRHNVRFNLVDDPAHEGRFALVVEEKKQTSG